MFFSSRQTFSYLIKKEKNQKLFWLLPDIITSSGEKVPISAIFLTLPAAPSQMHPDIPRRRGGGAFYAHPF